MPLGYYPGCSLHGTAKEFDQSTRAVAGSLNFQIEEVRDWSCCGATSAHATNHLLGVALPARNLALAEAQGLERILTPCAACYSRMATARHEMKEDAALAQRILPMLGRPFKNSVGVVSVVELLRDMAPAVKEKVTRPLADLKVACYYGCLLLRPTSVTSFDDPEAPTSMETVVAATGAKAVDWNLRMECCGGGFSISRTGSVLRLSRDILDSAREAGAQVVVVACPMCQSNLDFRQSAISKRMETPLDMPVLYITQLVGIALGLSADSLGLRTHYVDAMPLYEKMTAPKAAPQTAENA